MVLYLIWFDLVLFNETMNFRKFASFQCDKIENATVRIFRFVVYCQFVIVRDITLLSLAFGFRLYKHLLELLWWMLWVEKKQEKRERKKYGNGTIIIFIYCVELPLFVNTLRLCVIPFGIALNILKNSVTKWNRKKNWQIKKRKRKRDRGKS